ncbi:hypothetical protein C0993_000504 [Termitomyces sp. T159_Od127]|nr:hypothetical protein C0993_000504 [Termitomyces sp. T159_Od127]
MGITGYVASSITASSTAHTQAQYSSSSSGDAAWVEVNVVDVLVEVVEWFSDIVLGESPELVLLGKEHIKHRRRRSIILAVFPSCTVLSRLFGGVSWRYWRLRRALCAIINERRDKPTKHPQEETVRLLSTNSQLPDLFQQHDLLSFLTSEPNTTSTEIANALLDLNIQAVPSCTLNLTNAIYHLAACSKNTIHAMRKEIKDAVRADGWTAAALDRMVRVDSFLKETLRLSGLDARASVSHLLMPAY